MIVISDTSVLSCLAELGELDLPQRLYGTVTVTITVQREALHPRAPSALRHLFSEPPAWLLIVPDAAPVLPETHALDPGEASAITLAWQHRSSSLLLMDEKRGRRVAAALGLRLTGAAGMICDAASAGLLDFEATFQRLAQTRFRLSAALVGVLRQRYQDSIP